MQNLQNANLLNFVCHTHKIAQRKKYVRMIKRNASTTLSTRAWHPRAAASNIHVTMSMQTSQEAQHLQNP